MFRSTRTRLGPALAILAVAASCQATAPRATVSTPPAHAAKAAKLTSAQQFERAEAALAASRFEEAELAYQQARSSAELAQEAQWGLQRVYYATGRYALAAAAPATPLDNPALAQSWLVLRAQALAATGNDAAAIGLLHTLPAAAESRLLMGQLLIATGKRAEAQPVLMSIIDDYNEDRITETDALGMAQVGRAAQLLRSAEDANQAFNAAEQAGPEPALQTLLWRVELFVNHNDPDHAEEVLEEVLKRAPNDPEALVWMANVKLEQALDFDEARRLVDLAFKSNPNLARGYAVLAGIALRDMKLEEAETQVAAGLRINPNHLELLSLRGATRFLADDSAGFEQAQQAVMTRNPEFSEFYTIVGLYAEWEHRYDDIVRLMQHAVTIDRQDAKAHAQLGLNLIRGGDDNAGLFSLRTAFSLDPYNVRVFNTLNLYEKVIPKAYTDVPGQRFNLRYSKIEKPILERYVPELLDQAWRKMVNSYAFEPSTPVGIELYAERSNFAIRTSGLPQTAIQGVCFGKTLASMSPYYEKFNVGMTLWHELAHVFHIQLSKNHVPRWFTEGLAEYETLVERPEWSRERDTELYLAYRAGRLPKIGAMNEAFTRAEDIGDVAVAYYASTQIVRMLAEAYGYPKLREMLVLWGQGLRTEEVTKTALGKTTADLDVEFQSFLTQKLARFEGQFVPSQRIGNPERVREFASQHRDDPDALSRYAVLLMTAKEFEAADRVVEQLLRLDPKHADGLWLSARLALHKGDGENAEGAIQDLLDQGKDGYEIQLMRSKAAELLKDPALMQASLERAHAFDPEQAEALYGLLELARKDKDSAAEQQWLRKLTRLEEHNGVVFRSLVHSLIDTPDKPTAAQTDEAVDVGLSAVYADMDDPASHVAYALALEAAGRQPDAIRAFEGALVAPGSDGDLANAHLEFARYWKRHGQLGKVRPLVDKAKGFDADASL